ncbi:MAG: RES family NAD+ phosphorylase [Gemmatimonadales bacterium]|nr:RES family NAD+ phosphorylase [Gemmatimonadales bacterium]
MTGGRPAWRLPPPDLDQRPLPIVLIAAGTPVVRIHTRHRDPLYFGRTGEARFDSPDGAYGVCYLGLDDAAAFVETILRDQDLRGVARSDLTRRALADGVITRPVKLVAFGGSGLSRLRATAGTVHSTYRVTQAWSRALWAHTDQPDGLQYRSRFDDDQRCVALFDRASAALRFTASTPLTKVPGRLGPLLDRYDLGLYD